ncbi:paaX-like protein [bacterium BMS3Abin14]|nr:paaX-like protein [bacterium BMS3Abin14]
MLSGVITSKTKINILVKLFLNPAMRAYLRELASEFKVSTNSVRTELNNLTKNGVLVSEREGRNVYYRANTEHPLFPELSSMVRKITGIDKLAHSVIERLGNLEAVYLVGDYAEGKDSGIIDIVLIGDVDKAQLEDITGKTEKYIKRRVRSLVLSPTEFKNLSTDGTFRKILPIWQGTDSNET